MSKYPFYEVLSRDSKFQHLYSEWVKKQVGIEDENVEFGFTGNFDKPYIEFDKITSLSDDYREVFENTHNLYFNKIVLTNISLNENNISNQCSEFVDKYYNRVVNIGIIESSEKIAYIYIDANEYSIYYSLVKNKVTDIYKGQEKIL